MKPTSIRIAAVAILQVFIAGTLRADLPQEAQDDIKQGNAAWQKQDYAQAVQHYQDALKIAPDAPEIYGYLGLTESKMPGREMRAICWYSAYLAANPGASNAEAVRKEIDALNVKSHSNSVLLIRAGQLAAANLPTEAARDHGFYEVVNLWASIGEYATAQATADKIVGSDDKSDAETNITRTQLSDGDIAGAQKSAMLIPSAYWKSTMEGEIATAQARAGDIAGAQKSAALVTDERDKSAVNSAIAMAQAEAGGIETWKKQVELIADVHSKIIAERKIALAQAKAGNLPGAQATFQIALKNTGEETVAIYKDASIQGIAIAQAQAGDIKGAQETAGLITDADAGLKEEIGSAIATAQALAGDIPGAQKTASAITDVYFKEVAGSYIAQAQAKAAGSPAQPRSVVQLSEWLSEVGKFGMNSALFLDPVGYLKTLTTDDPVKTFDALDTNVGGFITQQAIIDNMLKKQASQ